LGAERPTAQRPAVPGAAGKLRAEHTTPPDAFALLDHRTRTRSVALADAPPGRYLSAEDGEEVRLVPLDQPIVHIGRGLGADIRVEDPQVSRRHAIIAQRGDGARVLDDRSSNGTHVNGRAVTIGYLNDGDVLRLGRVVLRFVEIGTPAPARPLRRFPLAVVGRRQVITASL
jgi:pSer/pThr/pTyr-binding forkhead associated (FHA) protein